MLPALGKFNVSETAAGGPIESFATPADAPVADAVTETALPRSALLPLYESVAVCPGAASVVVDSDVAPDVSESASVTGVV